MPEEKVEDLLSDTNNEQSTGDKTNNQNQTQTTKLKLRSGEELSPEQLVEKYESLHRLSTKTAQELSQLKKQVEHPETNQTIDPKDEALVAELKRLHVAFVQDVDSRIESKGTEIEQRASRRSVAANKLDTALTQLTQEFAFVDKDKVLHVIANNPNLDMTIEGVAHALYPQEFAKEEAKKLTGTQKQNSVPQTESSGASVNTPPGKPVLRFNDGSAMRAALELLSKGK